MREKILHSFEAGRRGKPDEFESGVANLISGLILSYEKNARFDVRVAGGYSFQEKKYYVIISGEISEVILEKKDFIKNIKKLFLDRYNFVYKTTHNIEDFDVEIKLTPQSQALSDNPRAGDSGTSIAVAYNDTPMYLPWERYLAVDIRNLIDEIYLNDGAVPAHIARSSKIDKLPGLRADGKVEVTAFYREAEFLELNTITIAAEHEESLSLKKLRHGLDEIIRAYLRFKSAEYGVDFGTPATFINSAGAWNEGGWKVDAGSREAKPYRDGFSTYGVCEDSFSGEDPSKPSGTGAFLARWVAVSVVANNLAKFARVTLTYQIGNTHPKINIYTNDTAIMDQKDLTKLIERNFFLSIHDGIANFDLREKNYFTKIVESSDFFHNEAFPWNQSKELDK